MAKSLRRVRPASPSFSATRTVGLASREEETKTTRERRGLWGRRETEKAEERGSLEEREREDGEGRRRVWEVALAAAAMLMFERCLMK